MTQHALLVDILEGFHKQNETRNFQQLIEALRKPPGAPNFAKIPPKVRSPQILLIGKHFAKLWAGANYSVTLTLDTSGLSARGSCTRAASQRPARAWCQEALLGATALVSAHASRIRTTPMRVRGPT